MSWFGEALKLWGDVDPEVGGFANNMYKLATGGGEEKKDGARTGSEALHEGGDSVDQMSQMSDAMHGHDPTEMMAPTAEVTAETVGEAAGPAGAAFATGTGIGQAIEDGTKDSGLFHDSHGQTEGLGEMSGDRGTQVQEWADQHGGNKTVDFGLGLATTLAQWMP